MERSSRDETERCKEEEKGENKRINEKRRKVGVET
jgi:hypothetical protein